MTLSPLKFQPHIRDYFIARNENRPKTSF